MIGLGGAAAMLAQADHGRAESGAAGLTPAKPPEIKLGSIDLREIEAIDAHTHERTFLTASKSNAVYARGFADGGLPPGQFPEKDALRDRLIPAYAAHWEQMPPQVGLRNYIARTYGVEPTRDNLDAVIARHPDATVYYREKMDYERIAAVVLQSESTDPVRPKALFPDDRFVWTFSIGPLIQPGWARDRGITEIDAFKKALLDVVTTCATNGCRGIKLPIAYYRPISFRKVSRADADRALKIALAATPSAFIEGRAPIYDDDKITAALWAYEDYLLNALFVHAGELGLNIIIHVCVALNTLLRADWNDPRGLYHTFTDAAVQAAGTRFVLIHSGYPYHHHVASFISQFPNVYTDLSYISHHPGTLEEVLRVFLGLAPSDKIMHGSDFSGPEAFAYSVDNERRILAKVLADYRDHYGWTDRDCERMARNVLSGTARKVFNIPARG
nr:amidohydrolase family protein [Sphingomonas sp. Y57]